ncbi:MAG: radical SAM protein [Polyangiaceae bacterium]
MAVSDWPSPPERWAENSLLVAFSFRCNLACTFCMVEDVLHVYEGTTLDAFRRHVEREGALRGIRRVIFSGGEVTLAKTLPDYIRFARSLPGIEHVRLQTNATRLSDRAYLDTLLRAGADEFFISLHGHDASTCDAITRRPGSFADILAGMRAVNDAGATLITNTAIAADNIRTLPRIVDTVAPFAPLSMELWSYWPRADESGARGHFVPLAEQLPFVLRTLEACVAAGIPPAVKWFPKCLLGEYALYHDDGTAPSVIELSAHCAHGPRPRPPASPRGPRLLLSRALLRLHLRGHLAARRSRHQRHFASGRCAGLSRPVHPPLLAGKQPPPAPPPPTSGALAGTPVALGRTAYRPSRSPPSSTTFRPASSSPTPARAAPPAPPSRHGSIASPSPRAAPSPAGPSSAPSAPPTHSSSARLRVRPSHRRDPRRSPRRLRRAPPHPQLRSLLHRPPHGPPGPRRRLAQGRRRHHRVRGQRQPRAPPGLTSLAPASHSGTAAAPRRVP